MWDKDVWKQILYKARFVYSQEKKVLIPLLSLSAQEKELL